MSQVSVGLTVHRHAGTHEQRSSDACMSTGAHTTSGVCLSSYQYNHSHTDTVTLYPAPTPCLPCLLRAGGEYFSDEQMRFRAPLLYEQYIGQYLTQEELSARTPAHQPPKPGSHGTPACPLSDLLLQSYQERELQQRLLQQQEEEEACQEEEEEVEDSDKEGEGQWQGGPGI